MKIKNQIMLITYANSMGGSLASLQMNMDRYFTSAIGGIHILPFFPSSADRGFAPITYYQVDEGLGSWDDLARLSTDYYLMYDFMANHISASSEYFLDYLAHGDDSQYSDLFICYRDFWEGGEPSDAQIDMIYKRKPRAPYIDVEFADKSREKIWCTFSPEQVDLDVTTHTTRQFYRDSLGYLCDHYASIIRLDAFAYITKRAGTSCFFVEPDVWECLEYIDDVLDEHSVLLLPEIHEHYSMQLKIAQKGYYVYDFALPMLVLHALYSADKSNLEHWLSICPRKQFTTLDTHDGIGIVDVVDLMSDEDIEFTKSKMYTEGANVKRVYNTDKYNNLDIYQVNCTYYSALGNDDNAYILARAIQFFTPGIPQVYYVGLLAGANDIELLEATQFGRNINRHDYTDEEIAVEVERDVVGRLLRMMTFRNEHPAFDGSYTTVDNGKPNTIEMMWSLGDQYTRLSGDLHTRETTIEYTDTSGAQCTMHI